MTTLKDMSKKLNLSVTTISRALNGFPEVNEETRERVLAAAEAMNYRPNPFARQLVTGQSGMVGMILQASPELTDDLNLIQIITGLSQHFSARDLQFILHVSTEQDVLKTYRQMVTRNTLDGFILTGPLADDPRIRFLSEKNIPFVVHGRSEGAVAHPFYDIDNYQVAYDATQHLLDLGHQQIALVDGESSLAFARERRRGFLDALAARELAVPDCFIRHASMTEKYGFSTAFDLLRVKGQAPTAFVCANTLIAAGVFAAARRLELRIPDDLSVIAHDDALRQVRAVSFSPALTVTRSPLRDACLPLAELLVRRIEGESVGDLQQVVHADLIIRHSTAKPGTYGAAQ